jgi:hypothetical protein
MVVLLPTLNAKKGSAQLADFCQQDLQFGRFIERSDQQSFVVGVRDQADSDLLASTAVGTSTFAGCSIS